MQAYTDINGLSEYSGIPVSTLRDYKDRDGLPYFKLRGKLMFKLSEFDHWMERWRVDTDEDLSAIVDNALKAVAPDRVSDSQ